MNRDYDLIALMTEPDAVSLSIARDRLKQAGINCHVTNESTRAMYGRGMFGFRHIPSPQLVVTRKDFRKAAKVLGIPVNPEFDDKPHVRKPGLIGCVRWIIGLD